MNKKGVLLKTYYKIIILCTVFFIAFIGSLIVIYFYYKTLIAKIDKIYNLKEQIEKAKIAIGQKKELKKMDEYFETTVGKSLILILNNIDAKEKRTYNEINNLLINFINANRWQIISYDTNINAKTTIMTILIPSAEETKQLWQFLKKELIIFYLTNFKIIKQDNNYLINIIFKL